MDEKRQISREDAQASLDAVAQSRDKAVKVKARPVWLDASFCVGVGIVMVVGNTGPKLPSVPIALGCLTLIAIVYALASRRWVRRKGRIVDERSVGKNMLMFLMAYAPIVLSGMFRPDEGWPLPVSIGVAVFIAIGGFAYLRLDERYQARRLAAGDYDPYDLV